MNNYPKISVVTPNFNQGDSLRQTIKSVLDQGYPNLEYIIIDGGSTDGSVDIIREYEDQLFCWVSETDNGMYHAINKGFERSSGSIMCWINSDDILLDRALFKVAEIFNANKQVHWLQGQPTIVDEAGMVVRRPKQVCSPYHFYLKRHMKGFSFIQQESTFWSRSLWEKSGGKLFEEFKVAADFDLWMRFFTKATLFCSNQTLGAFRLREGQKSSDRSLYLSEAEISLKRHFKNLSLIRRLRVIGTIYLANFLERSNLKLFAGFKTRLTGKLFRRILVNSHD